jgi:hypothetical protein
MFIIHPISVIHHEGETRNLNYIRLEVKLTLLEIRFYFKNGGRFIGYRKSGENILIVTISLQDLELVFFLHKICFGNRYYPKCVSNIVDLYFYTIQVKFKSK